ncbi:MAG: hypothetical protein QM811_13310 [Pirellulales bacterium]
MNKSFRGIVHDGKIEFLDPLTLSDGAKVVVIVATENESDFWIAAGESSLRAIWDNPDDDVYEKLLDHE